MPALLRFTFVVSLFTASVLVSCPVRAAEKTAADLLPKTSLVYVEIPRPPALIDLVADHPLTAQFAGHSVYKRLAENPQYQKATEMVDWLEQRLGMDLRPALSAATAQGIYAGIDAASQGGAVLVNARDAECAQRACETLLAGIHRQATEKGNPDPISSDDYRGIAVHQLTVPQLKETRFATSGSWLLVSSKPFLMRLVLNNLLDEETVSLNQDEQFQTMYKARPADACAWAYGDLRLLRSFGVLKNALGKKSDNPPLEFLAGGVMGAIPDAPYVTAALKLDAAHAALSVTLPADPAVIAKDREFYVGPQGAGVAPPTLWPKNALLSIAAYRDMALLWRHAPDLFNEEINAKFAESEAGLSTLFAGRNFRDEILGNLEPGFQLVVARQEYPPEGVVPAMKLPAVAIVARMKNPQETSRIFKITFQSAIGFLNVAGGMNGVAPLDVNSERRGDMLVVSSEYLPPKDPKIRGAAAPHFNASPTAIFVGDTFVLSSAKSLALEVAKLAQEAKSEEKLNIEIRGDLRSLVQLGGDNKELLVSQNMLQSGTDQESARRATEELLTTIAAVKSVDTKLITSPDSLTWQVHVQLKQP